MVGLVTRGYLDAAALLAAEHRSERERLLSGLLDGVCRRRRPGPPECPQTARCSCWHSPHGTPPGTRRPRRLRRVRAALSRAFGSEVLAVLTEGL
ncbi:hypothetical protein ACFQ78_11010 [Streptomyces sp. NPDC056519]|uniref:hypothetical protein n=1 Tax=Streptomyces sp. NPDC056519 TaxID=3345849 RepID=UPI003682073D